jgi:hypothetical protein
MYNQEFTDRFSGRYFGRYRGRVISIQDPRQLGRIQAVVPRILGKDESLGWAWPLPTSGGGVNSGDLNLPEINDYVWIEFEEGDTSRPVWSPGSWGIREGENMVPKHSRGVPDDIDYAMREDGNIPPSQYSGQYGNVRVIQNRSSGNLIELDDTEGDERLQISHKVGTRFEMTSDGSLQEVVAGTARRKIGGAHYVEVAANEERKISGSSNFEAVSSRTEVYGGPVNQSFKELNQTIGKLSRSVKSETNVIAGPWYLQCASQGSLMFNGGLAFMVQQNLQMTVLENAEIAVSNSTGEPTSDSILLQGYNGNVHVLATDVTGSAIQAEILLKGNSPTNNILLGGDSASEPMILGNVHKEWLGVVLDYLFNHTHTSGMGPTGPTIEPVVGVSTPTVSALKALITNALSKVIMGKGA